MQYRDGHISTCFNKDTHDIYIVHMCLCQLFIRYCYSLFIYLCSFYSFLSFIYFVPWLTIHLFILLLISLLVRSLFYSLFKKRKEQFWSWTVFRYFDPANHHQYRVNKHHTTDSHRLCLSIGAKDLLPT
jgi:hypothetical protein